jgi:hypothetical protein
MSQGCTPLLPETVEPPGSDPGQIERRRAVAADAGEARLDDLQLVAELDMVAAGDVGDAATDDAVLGLGAGGDAQAAVVEEGARAALGDVELVVGGVVDDARHRHAVALEADGDGELGNAVEEVGGAVEGVDDPGVGGVGALDLAALLTDETVAGAGLHELGHDDLLGLAVGGGDEVGRPLHRDLQMLDLAEVALEAAAGLQGGADHDVEKGGTEHIELSAGFRGVMPARRVMVKRRAAASVSATTRGRPVRRRPAAPDPCS